MDYFNSTFKGKLPAIKSIDAKRKKAIKARVAQYGKQAIFDVFQKVLDSPFYLEKMIGIGGAISTGYSSLRILLKF